MKTRYMGIFTLPLLILGLLGSPISYAHTDSPEFKQPNVFIGPKVNFMAVSESYEAVGQRVGNDLFIYVDERVSNAPVLNAVIKAITGGKELITSEAMPGVYRAPLEHLFDQPQPIHLTLQVSSTLGNESISGELDSSESTPHLGIGQLISRIAILIAIIVGLWVLWKRGLFGLSIQKFRQLLKGSK